MIQILLWWQHYTGGRIYPANYHAHGLMAQMENARALNQRMIVATNFPFEHAGIEAVRLTCSAFPDEPRTSKLTGLIELFSRGLLPPSDVYWFHDWDVWQLREFDPPKPEIYACTGLHKNPVGFSTASMFFTERVQELFPKWLAQVCCGEERMELEERALNKLIADEAIPEPEKINLTYNYRARNWANNWQDVDKPLKVIHMKPGPKRLQFFCKTNPTGESLIPPHLREIFERHYPGKMRKALA